MRIVAEAWRAAMPAAPFDPALSLAEAGVDSLAVMGMVLRLERAIGRPVPLDLLHPDATPASLAAGLAGRGADEAAGDGRPTIFFLPGIGGDEPMLAAIRQALASRARFDALAYPDPPAEAPPRLETMVAAMCERIRAAQPAGPIALAGYSFGGVLAVEIARALKARGRDVALLILFDPIPIRNGARLR